MGTVVSEGRPNFYDFGHRGLCDFLVLERYDTDDGSRSPRNKLRCVLSLLSMDLRFYGPALLEGESR